MRKPLSPLAFLPLLFSSACLQGQPPATQAEQTLCQPGVAEVQVGDGFLSDLCGCQEGAGLVAPSGQTLTCTVNTGTVVFFEFTGAQLEHQIISTGSPSFPASPISNPSDSSMPALAAFPVTLSAPGTYSFQDAFESSLTGQLIAM